MVRLNVTINDYDCFSDWNLILTERKIESPEAKTRTIEIPGMDGVLDVTDAVYGGVKFKNRKITLKFVCKTSYYEWPTTYSDIMNKIHGKSVTTIFSDDSWYKWTGRASVSSDYISKTAYYVEIEIDADPYKVNLLDGTKSL